ncbi:phosphoribosylformylglycinamidine cyclo-ligase, chloroplastic [Cinnamomum micranthum f. kanehirae]|uniref:Phosphoribosylformylglycinamidine cyclo-ligase n=1 Tax=Cinnamomum micranthum f. kanehirae TaxID=337451 RepID=A0A3S3QTV7_9MAGN|nr:phosphoribosylformylglycinamidine cyclo-ligase, chloroplastic [Cinnamomum micranthum f. kanehirae]
MNTLLHGVSSSVASLKRCNEKPYFPPKSSFFNNPSFFFQLFSRKAHLSFSCTAAYRPKPIGKRRTWRCDGEEEGWNLEVEWVEDGDLFGISYSTLFRSYGMMTRHTKVDFAVQTGIEEANGADLGVDVVAINVNNIITFGAKPSTLCLHRSGFIDRVGLAEKVFKGVDDACKQSDCLLGEAFLPLRGYDAMFGLECRAIGRVRKDSVIDGENIVAGDVLIGLPSSGVHCWGFSLVSRVLAQSGLSLKDQLPGGSGKPITLGEALMVPTVIYVKQVLDIISKGGVKGIAHITRGGFMNSLPRAFENCPGLGATIYKDAWEVPAVFKLIQEAGRIGDAEMRRTFNMGIGMVLVVSPDAATRILGEQHGGYSAYRIGEVTVGEGVTYQ